ncbi:desaturase, partial [Mesorhizobium sp. LCM 4576]
MTTDTTKSEVTLPTKQTWNYMPNLPLEDRSIFNFRRGPFEGLKLIWNSWLPISDRLIVVGVSFLTWYYLSPTLETARTLSLDWIAAIYLRNLAMIVLLAGGMHLYLYTFNMQGDRLRYDARPFHKNNALFTFNSQFLDNVFWSVASGVTIWTAYEVIGLWCYANGYLPMLTFASHPVWFILWFVFLPLYGVFHFYWIHRFLHWGPLYNHFHSVHHRNVNVGPWSGMSMHPIEHL